jgi:purine-nucleoside phosphorylase
VTDHLADDHACAGEAVELIHGRSTLRPLTAIVLGSGLADFVERISEGITIAYGDIPHWPRARVAGHPGTLTVGHLGGQPVVVCAGRVHFYEGHTLRTVVFPVRVLARLGVRHLLLTNAAGGINPRFAPGTLMVIDDHVNLFGTNPLVGANDERIGPRFPDMTEVYSKRLRAAADETARDLATPIAHGIYAGVHGPSYETPAEIRYLRTIGADAVGMSTVPEAIAARHAGLEVFGLSCITNMAAGLLGRPLDHQEVMDTAARVRVEVGDLLEGLVRRLS